MSLFGDCFNMESLGELFGGSQPDDGGDVAELANNPEGNEEGEDGGDNHSDDSAATITVTNPGNHPELANKSCVGCGCKTTTRSPLCTSPEGFRDWNYPNWQGSWDRHCAAAARVRFLPEMGRLQVVEGWLAESLANRTFFQKRAIAYMSLKLDPNPPGRVTYATLEARVHLFDTIMYWHRCGATMGVPSQPHCVIYDIKRASDLFGNPFSAGGQAVAVSMNGKVTVGISMPMSSAPTGCKRLVPDEVIRKEGNSYDSVMANVAMEVEDEEAMELFRQLYSEYNEIRAAREDEELSAAVRAANSEFGGDGSSGPARNGDGAKSLAIVPFGLRRASSSANLGVSETGSAAGGSGSSDTHGAIGLEPPLSRRPTPKKTKADKMVDEITERLKVLEDDDFSNLSCNKETEGLLKRASNLKVKLLEECDTDGTKRVGDLHAALNLVFVFGSVLKRQTRKKGSDTCLQQLVQPLKDMEAESTLTSLKWSPALELLRKQVHFWSHWSECQYQEACQYLKTDMLADLFRESTVHSGDEQVNAIQLSLPIMEKVYIEQVKALKTDKKHAKASQEAFINFFLQASAFVPKYPKLAKDYPEKRRAETFRDQVAGVCTLVRFAFPAPSDAQIWPSTAKQAYDNLNASPKTRFAMAFETYVGARGFLATVAEKLQTSSADIAALRRIEEVKASITDCRNQVMLQGDMAAYRPALDKAATYLQSLAGLLPKMSAMSFESAMPLMVDVCDAVTSLMAQASPTMANEVLSEVGCVLTCFAAPGGDGATALVGAGMSTAPIGGFLADTVSMQKVALGARKLMTTLPMWLNRYDAGCQQFSNFLDKVLFPLAKEKYDKFERFTTELNTISEQVKKLINISVYLAQCCDSIGPLIECPAGRSWQDIVDEAQEAKKTGDTSQGRKMVYLDYILQLAKSQQLAKKIDLSNIPESTMEKVSELFEWMRAGNFVVNLVRAHMTMRLEDAAAQFAKGVQLTMLRPMSPEVFSKKLADNEGIEGLLNLTGDDIKGLSTEVNNLAASETDDLPFNNLPWCASMQMLESMVMALSLGYFPLDMLDDGEAKKLTDELRLFLCHVMSKLKTVVALLCYMETSLYLQGDKSKLMVFDGTIADLFTKKRASTIPCMVKKHLVLCLCHCKEALKVLSEDLDKEAAKTMEQIGIGAFNRTLFREWVVNALAWVCAIEEKILKVMAGGIDEVGKLMVTKIPEYERFFKEDSVDTKGLAELFNAEMKATLQRCAAAFYSFSEHLAAVVGKISGGATTFATHELTKNAGEKAMEAMQKVTVAICIESSVHVLQNLPGDSASALAVLQSCAKLDTKVPSPLLKRLEEAAGATWSAVSESGPKPKRQKTT